jgi:Uncharacterised nucleotidyltransferase
MSLSREARQPGSIGSGGIAPAAFWGDVERIVESRLGETDALCAHGFGPLAADLLERGGREIPLELVYQQRVARVGTLTAPAILARIERVWQGPMLLLKGPEAAARYPQGARAFGDLDLLVPDAQETQQTLLAGGFVEEDDPGGRWLGIHHLAPLRWPGLPLKVEVHDEPKWPEGLPAPRKAELFEAAVPAAVGVPGVLAPAPAHHALLLAAHAWAHQPLRRACDLLDAGSFAAEVEAAELSRLVRAWGLTRLWSTTSAALDAFLTGRRTWPLRLWAAHVAELRVQTVLEEHLERLLSPFWGFPVSVAARHAARALGNEFRPAFDENWREKAVRSAAAVRRAFVPVTRHRRLLGDSATRGQRRTKPPEPGR